MTLIKRKRAPSVLVHVDLLLIVHALLMFGTHAFLTPQSASLLRISSHTIEVNNRATSRIARTNMQDKFRGKEQENQKLKVPRKRNVRIPDWLQGKEPSEKGTSRKSRTPVSFMKRSLRKVRGIIDDDEHSGWLSWMSGVGGTPRGVEEIKLREPVELGGIARSDRYASRDWFHNTLNLHSSAVLRDIRNPVISLTCWATFISLLHRSVLAKSQIMANRMCLHPQPHSLMVSTLGLLLVFKTNSAYQRFKVRAGLDCKMRKRTKPTAFSPCCCFFSSSRNACFISSKPLLRISSVRRRDAKFGKISSTTREICPE